MTLSLGALTPLHTAQIPLLPVGWLTVTVEAIKHPPLALGQHVPDRELSLVVRTAGSQQHVPIFNDAAYKEGGRMLEEEEELTTQPADEIQTNASLIFEVQKQQLQDRVQRVVVEVHGSAGVHGTVSLPLLRAARPAGEYDGVYELTDPQDKANAARGYKQHGEIAPTSVSLRFFYLASSQKIDRSSQPMLYTRGPVTPFSDKDLGMTRRPQSAQNRPPSALSKGAEQIWRSLDAESEVYSGSTTRQLPLRPQSAQPDRSAYHERNQPRTRVVSRPQSADPCRRPDTQQSVADLLQQRTSDPLAFRHDAADSLNPFHVGSRPQSALSHHKRPNSATVRSPNVDPIFVDTRRVAGMRRPASAGARRISSAASTRQEHTEVRKKRQVLMMPIARAAELHAQGRQPHDILFLDASSVNHNIVPLEPETPGAAHLR